MVIWLPTSAKRHGETWGTKEKEQKSHRQRKSRHSKDPSVANAMTKVEHKALYNEWKRTLKTTWPTASDDSSEGEANIDMSKGLKKYTIEDRKVIFTKAHETKTRNS